MLRLLYGQQHRRRRMDMRILTFLFGVCPREFWSWWRLKRGWVWSTERCRSRMRLNIRVGMMGVRAILLLHGSRITPESEKSLSSCILMLLLALLLLLLLLLLMIRRWDSGNWRSSDECVRLKLTLHLLLLLLRLTSSRIRSTTRRSCR